MYLPPYCLWLGNQFLKRNSAEGDSVQLDYTVSPVQQPLSAFPDRALKHWQTQSTNKCYTPSPKTQTEPSNASLLGDKHQQQLMDEIINSKDFIHQDLKVCQTTVGIGRTLAKLLEVRRAAESCLRAINQIFWKNVPHFHI